MIPVAEPPLDGGHCFHGSGTIPGHLLGEAQMVPER